MSLRIIFQIVFFWPSCKLPTVLISLYQASVLVQGNILDYFWWWEPNNKVCVSGTGTFNIRRQLRERVCFDARCSAFTHFQKARLPYKWMCLNGDFSPMVRFCWRCINQVASVSCSSTRLCIIITLHAHMRSMFWGQFWVMHKQQVGRKVRNSKRKWLALLFKQSRTFELFYFPEKSEIALN